MASGVLHPFHALKDGWKERINISTREQFRSKSGGRKLSDVCVEGVQEHGPPYYVTVGELMSFLRTEVSGKDNWSIGVRD